MTIEELANIYFASLQRLMPLKASNTPGPCDHVDRKFALGCLEKPGSVFKTGFLSLCPRFPRKKEDKTPGMVYFIT